MNQPGKNDYLESKILTATGPQLHLMLIEGAIRYVRQADEQYAANNEGNGNSALLHSMAIIEELIAGVKHDDHEINQKLADLYHFLYRSLTSCYVNADRQKLADVLKILGYQRETWQLAVERVAKMGAESDSGETKPKSQAIAAPHIGGSTPASQSLSLDA